MKPIKSFLAKFHDPVSNWYRAGLVAQFVFYSILLVACPLSLFFTVPQLSRIVVAAVQDSDGATLVTGAVTIMVIGVLSLVLSSRSKNDSSKESL